MILAVLYSDFLKDDSRVEEIHAEPVFSCFMHPSIDSAV